MKAVTLRREQYDLIKRLSPEQLHSLVHALIDNSEGIDSKSDMEFGVEIVYIYITSKKTGTRKGGMDKAAECNSQTSQIKKIQPNLPSVSVTVADTVSVPKSKSVSEIVPVSVAAAVQQAVETAATAASSAALVLLIFFVFVISAQMFEISAVNKYGILSLCHHSALKYSVNRAIIKMAALSVPSAATSLIYRKQVL